jgi:hypothetical protein
MLKISPGNAGSKQKYVLMWVTSADWRVKSGLTFPVRPKRTSGLPFEAIPDRQPLFAFTVTTIANVSPDDKS